MTDDCSQPKRMEKIERSARVLRTGLRMVGPNHSHVRPMEIPFGRIYLGSYHDYQEDTEISNYVTILDWG